MNDIAQSKISVIYGDDDLDRNIKMGDIASYGKIDSEDMHILSLMEFIKDKYSDIDILSKVNINYQPETASYLLTKMFGHIIFLNITSNLKKYGLNAIILLPEDVNESVFNKLKDLVNSLDNFSLIVYYNFFLDDGILNASSLMINDSSDVDRIKNVTNTKKKAL